MIRIPLVLCFVGTLLFLVPPFANWTLEFLLDFNHMQNGMNQVFYLLAASGVFCCLAGLTAVARGQVPLLVASVIGLSAVWGILAVIV